MWILDRTTTNSDLKSSKCHELVTYSEAKINFCCFSLNVTFSIGLQHSQFLKKKWSFYLVENAVLTICLLQLVSPKGINKSLYCFTAISPFLVNWLRSLFYSLYKEGDFNNSLETAISPTITECTIFRAK